MAFVTDTFTDTSATALGSHTGEAGATWTKNTTRPGDDAQISDANRLQPGGSGTGGYWYASGAPASADYDVQADLAFVTATTATNRLMGVAGRLSATAGTAYFFRYANDGTGAWQLFKQVAGSFTSLGSFAQSPPSAGTTRVAKLEMRGTAIKGYVDGTAVVTPGADSGVTAAGKAGLWVQGTATSTTGIHLDNFSASDPAAGGAATLHLLALTGCGA